MADLWHLVLDPLGYPFLVRGLLAAVMVGVVCSMVGTFIVLRGMAFFGDALAHSILPGVAIGYLVGGGHRAPLFWSGLLTAVIVALGIGAVRKSAELKEDTAIGIVFASMFALGVAMISTVRSYALDLAHILFGDVLGVSAGDLVLTAVLGGGVVLILVLFYKEFVLVSFDPILAATLRLPVHRLDNVLLVLIAVAIVVSLQTVGVALMVAMLVTPPATAFLLTRRLPVMMALGAVIGAAAGVTGLYASFYLSVASGAAIVLVSTAFFGLAVLLAPHRGWLWRHLG